ncbi:MAG: tRNA (N(6)-L-threonylcarbamoyladenosine(37)-C(2))-methylthiotransferase MtaB [Planctomycetes bacterium]|nr:tRNA (N(6)-L-threonylcarbamoyladenosine(37)-C(2))-methylthiotransferase MtaB [Planctomycetota bacterium]
MKTFSINTLGCKVNQYESQQIRQLCEQLGLHYVQTSDNPDLIAVNTCCVTHNASAKSRQSIRRAQKQNPNAAIIVFGCMPIVEQLNDLGENVYLIEDRDALTTELAQIIHSKPTILDLKESSTSQKIIRPKYGQKIKDKTMPNDVSLGSLGAFKGHTRAFLKVQDGCDGYCSYCIIPQTRPKVHNKPIADVITEAQNLVNAGHKEIVVTGIFLGAYGLETVRRKRWEKQENPELAKLLKKLSQVQGLKRVRLSSLEPADVTEQLLDVMANCPNIMPHLHLSLQSGSDDILKRMGRQYRTAEFLQKVELIKSKLDRPAITGDFIVGFPGETESDFEKTSQIAKDVGFSKMHVFPFSVRQGTAAAKMQNLVADTVIKNRCQQLRQTGDKLAFDFRNQFIGEEIEVLIENVSACSQATCDQVACDLVMGDTISGRAERYFMVHFNPAGAEYEKNQIVKLKLTENKEDGIWGAQGP